MPPVVLQSYVNFLLDASVLHVRLSCDTLGFDRVKYKDVEANYLILAKWFERVRDESVQSFHPQNSIMRTALVKADTAKGSIVKATAPSNGPG